MVAAAVNERFQGAAVVNTNMVFVDLPGDEFDRLREQFEAKHIRITRNRWVLHLDIDFDDVARIVAAIDEF